FVAIREKTPTSLRTLRADVPVELDAIVMKCLEQTVSERFASVADLAEALAPFGSRIARDAARSSRRILLAGPRAAHSTDAGPSTDANVGAAAAPLAASQSTVSGMTTSTPRAAPARFRVVVGIGLAGALAFVSAIGVVLIRRGPSGENAVDDPAVGR